MALTLVPKYVRAVAESLNAYYRVLKGVDPDSVFLRLNGGGSFQVRHSGTNAAVFTVNDGGIAGSISGGNIQNESITSAQIQNGTIDTVDLKDGSVTSVKIADQAIMDADVNNGAAIAVAKLADLGANNVLRSNGAGNLAGKVVNADIAAAGTANIAHNKLAAITANQILKDAGSGVVGGGLLVDANVAAAGTANIAHNKLAAITVDRILKDVGSGVVGGGLLVNANVAAGADIDGAKLLNNSVTSAKLSGGIPPPAGSGAADAWKAYATDSAGTTVALRTIQAEHILSGVVGVTKLGEIAGTGASPFMQISGIPQTYRRLTVQLIGRSTTAGSFANVLVTVEASPTPGGYYHQTLVASGTGVSAAENLGTSAYILAGNVPAAGSLANLHGSVTITFPEYALTNVLKPVEIVGANTLNNTAGLVQVFVGTGSLLLNPAVSLIRLTLGSGNWTTTSRMTLYGWAA